MSDHPYPHEQYAMSVFAVAGARNDPEETLQVAMTMRDVALISLSLVLVIRLFPEIGYSVKDLNRRMIELTKAQNFLDWEGEEIGFQPGD